MDMPLPRTVYIVDDDEAVRDSLGVLLESHGFSISEHASGAQFLDAFAEKPEGCVVLDIHMPGISGLEVLDILRADGQAIPVIAITGRGDPALRERLFHAGAFVVFDKPVEEDELVRAINAALAASPR